MIQLLISGLTFTLCLLEAHWQLEALQDSSRKTIRVSPCYTDRQELLSLEQKQPHRDGD
jgi:hypothetical protein